MSSETMLTLALTAAILAIAALAWAVARGLWFLAGRLWQRVAPGTARTRAGARIDDALPGRPWAERLRSALEGAGALAVYVAASLARVFQRVLEGARNTLEPLILRVPQQVPVTSVHTDRKLARAKSNLGGHAGAA